jgi:hypothetical protein
MKFKGTKGNWTFLDNPIPRSKKSPEFLLKSESHYLGSIWSQDMEIEEAEANAKLISCAPEMLESLIILQKRLEFLINLTPSGTERNIMCDENVLCLDLIKKATI